MSKSEKNLQVGLSYLLPLGDIKEECGSWYKTAKVLYAYIQNPALDHGIRKSHTAIAPRPSTKNGVRLPKHTDISIKNMLAPAALDLKKYLKLKTDVEAADKMIRLAELLEAYTVPIEERSAAVKNLKKRMSEARNNKLN